MKDHLALGSVVAFVLMVAGLILLIEARQLFARTPIGIAVQVGAVVLMVSARIAFGRRSFHAAANPTAGGVVTSGPYRYVRHPIYAAILYFMWATAIEHHTPIAIAGAVACTIGAIVRMVSEERLLVARYPEYADYMRRTRRVVPFVL